MDRSLTDIRDSGLLELYVLGDLAPDQQAEVEEALRTYPALRDDVREIERAFQHVAFEKAVPPPAGVLESTLRELGQTAPSTSPQAKATGRPGTWWALGGLVLVLAAALGYIYQRNADLEEQLTASNTELAACLTRAEAGQQQIATLNDLQRTDNQVVRLEPTAAFPTANLLLYHNPTTQRNYLAVAELPALAAGQAYQLWSLKEGVAPIPLDVFTAEGSIVPVTFEGGTGQYAITIEDAAGAQVPNLDQLVGVLGVG